MGCVSSHLLNQDDDFTQISQHIVSLTSTTYGLLTLDPLSSPTTVPPTQILPDPSPEVINSWELMAGLDSISTSESFRFSPQSSKPSPFKYTLLEKDPNFIKPGSRKTGLVNGCGENNDPNHKDPNFFIPGSKKPVLGNGFGENSELGYKDPNFLTPGSRKPGLVNGFEELCPPKGENKVVIYTTTLRGVRKTFESCNAVRGVLEGFGVFYSERDVSMDRGFRDELWELMKGKEKEDLVLPRVFVKGRYVGGVDDVLRIVEEGYLGHLLEGIPKSKAGYICEVCGGARFLPCGSCNGSCKVVMVMKKEIDGDQLGKTVTVKCSDCNENGLVRCPICS